MSIGSRRVSRLVVSAALLGLALFVAVHHDRAGDPPNPNNAFALHSGDHICIIGNTLADRMQHDGWLETLLQDRFPKLQLVVRNLGFSGDELATRLRSAGFGSPDDWLSFHKADVVFAFFGYNESFAGQEGLGKFKRDLEAFIHHTLTQKYNGRGAPRLVLFSPIAHENLHSRNLPDGKENNQRLELYTKAMAEVAAAQHVCFVNLFEPTREEYAKGTQPLTINGIHLNEYGNWLVARIIDRALFPGQSEPSRDRQHFEKLRSAVVDKDFYWFNRYRTVDGYNIYGGRSYEKYADNQTNRVVMQREMQVLDVMTANRDKRVWAVAEGGELAVDDSNTPPFIPVKTNKPGSGPNGTHLFLDGEEAIKKMTVAKGMKVNLFASEKEFPQLAKPVQMAWDTKGRLWVATWPSYPHWKPKEEMNDQLLIFEDTDGDGKADKCTVFANHLHCPTGFEFYNGGVLVAQAPDILFLKDSTGGDKADTRVRVVDGIDSADTHHTANTFTLDPGGALYFQEGTFHRTQVETPYGPEQRCADAGVYRYEPRAQKFEVYVSYAFANPHGHVFDRWGQDIVYDGTGANPYHGALFSGHVEYPYKHPHPPQVYQQRTRPCPGVEVLSSRHFPPENQDHLLVANVIGFQGILQYKVQDNGSSLSGTEVEPIVSSTDPNFRPSDIKIGPDGAIYFLDWHNPIIGHLQHHIRDPNRDRTHGRIYRITYESRPLLKSPKIAGEPIAKLLDLLKEPEGRVRYRAKIELGARESDQVVAGVNQWLARLDPKDPHFEHHQLEALWVHQYHNVVDVGLLQRVLHSTDFRARAAATRVLCYWRERVPNALELLEQLAGDPHPRVRLEAVRAASFLTTPQAVAVALHSMDFPSDQYLDYVRDETMKTLEPYWKKVLAQGLESLLKTDAEARYLLRHVGNEDLFKIKRSAAVFHEMLVRKGLRDEVRHEALAGLAKLLNRPEPAVLVDIIRGEDERHNGDSGAMFDLVRLLTDLGPHELQTMRDPIAHLASAAHAPVTRQLGYVALIAADGNSDNAWSLATQSAAALQDLLDAMPLIRDPAMRASLYAKVEPLLDRLPDQLGGKPEPAIRRSAMKSLASVRGEEAHSFKAIARFVSDDNLRQAAIQALQRIPSSYWPAEDARPLVDTILAAVRKVPARRRTSPATLDALQFADTLAGLLPPAEALPVRRQLGELGVRMITIRTVPDQMLFDKERIVVKAGKPAEIFFENTDLMPHNLVVTRPGALEEIGLLAEATATQPGAPERHYVPPSDKILLASQLLQPRASQRLSFTAPAEPGVYPFVCTYPGHWRRMYGAMYVVADLDLYLANPEGYLAKHPLPAVDELLKNNRPRKEWKYEELAGPVEQLTQGRSFSNGKQMFQAANCVACHRLNGAGFEIGPDLTKLDAKLKPVDILKDILEPSFRINEKYYTYVFETGSGKIITGLILEENSDVVKVTENPLVNSPPVVLKRSDILSRQKSPTSIMPKGLLDKLTQEEILDLLAYVIARGDAQNKLFQGSHGHGQAMRH